MSPDALKRALEAVSGAGRYQAWLYHQLQPHLGRAVLDVGSGRGELAALYGRRADRCVTVSDDDEELLALLRRRFEGSTHRVLRFSLTKPLPPETPRASFDTVTCVNVLEHLRADRAALQRLHQLLAPGGCLLLIVPALPCLFGATDQAVGHYRRYTRRTLNPRLRQAGFAIERQRYMNFFGLFTWWFAGRVLRRRAFNPRVCRLLDRLVPGLERLERRWAPPIGQSLVTVCRKP